MGEGLKTGVFSKTPLTCGMYGMYAHGSKKNRGARITLAIPWPDHQVGAEASGQFTKGPEIHEHHPF
jgi:hypothetical protein